MIVEWLIDNYKNIEAVYINTVLQWIILFHKL